MQSPHEKAPHDPLRFGESTDHRLGLIRESPNKPFSVTSTKQSNDESFGASIRETVGIEDDDTCDFVQGNTIMEEINNEDTGSDEEGTTEGVKLESFRGSVFIGDFERERRRRVLLQELFLDGMAKRIRSTENEEDSMRGRMKTKKRGQHLGQAQPCPYHHHPIDRKSVV